MDPSAPELRCVASLYAGGERVGVCLLITNGSQTIAVASAAVLRRAPDPCVILTRLDGSSSLPLKGWQLAHHAAIGIIELEPGAAFTVEVFPLHLASLSATLETRGAPCALVAIKEHTRVCIPTTIELDDGGGMADVATRIAKPSEPLELDGVPLFAWMPEDPVLARSAEIIAVALAVTTKGRLELVGLEDAGRVLPWAEATPPPQQSRTVTGEIK